MNSVEVWLDGGGAADTPPYQLLNIAESLKDNFRSKTIVEFPQLTVVSKGAGHPNKQQRRVRTSNKPERGIKKEDSGANEVETFVNNVKADKKRAEHLDRMELDGANDETELHGKGDVLEGMRSVEGVVDRAQRRGDSDWSGCESGSEEGEIVNKREAATSSSASLRLIAMYSDSEDSSC